MMPIKTDPMTEEEVKLSEFEKQIERDRLNMKQGNQLAGGF